MSYPKSKIESYQNFGGINLKTSEYTTAKNELLDSRNYTLERLGSLTSRIGTEAHLSLPVSTFLVKPQNSYVYKKEDGSSFLMFDSGMTLFALGSSLAGIDGTITENATTSVIMDFVTANDYLYYSPNGLRRFDGTDSLKIGPPSISLAPTAGRTPTLGITFNTSLGTGVTAVIPKDFYYWRASWLVGSPSLTDGKISQFFFLEAPKFPGSTGSFRGAGQPIEIGSTIVSQGQWLLWGFSVPPGFGVSSIALAYARDGVTNFVYAMPRSFTLTIISGVTTYAAVVPHFTTTQYNYSIKGPPTQGVDRLSWYNNMIFASKDNTIDVSTIEDIESFPPENKIIISGNPSDSIVAMTPFQDSLIIFKEDSIHELKGDSPETLSVVDISFEYGCVSPRGFCVFENKLWFVDKKGICEYQGSNILRVADKIEPLTDVADMYSMAAIHVKKLNQVWFSDGSLVFVYDYLADAWLLYDNLQIDKTSGLINIDYGSDRIDPFYWQSGASFHLGIRFGQSLMTDLGSAISLMIKTRYHQREDKSSTEVWRRFYLNTDVTGQTLGFTLLMRPDYGSSVYETRSLPMSQFQERIDFGIPAESLSVELQLVSSTKVRINGYTIESRYLRSV